jgi:large repetitive protein
MRGTRAGRWIAIASITIASGCSLLISTDDLDKGSSSSTGGSGGSPPDGGAVTTGGGDGGGGGTSTTGAGGGGGAIDPGLIAAWSFDETSGGVAQDSTGHGHDAILTSSASFTPDGQNGGALELHGLDFASVASLTGAVFPQTGTFSLWFRFSFDPADVTGRGIFDDYDTTRGHVFIRRAPNADPGQFQAVLQAAGGQYAFAAGIDAEQGVWRHVVVTWDASSEKAALYLDGALASSDSYAYPFEITYQSFKLGDGFVGAIDEVRLYDRALPPAEAGALP